MDLLLAALQSAGSVIAMVVLVNVYAFFAAKLATWRLSK